jgi:AGZA family xanthine/uracil permease-like MFS transporter
MSYRWARLGDVNAFFGLMLDNVVNLVILAGILQGVFKFPADIIYTKMFPGTALGVMFGDLVYTWMAFRLAKKTGRDDVTAMPLGLDAPSTIGMAFAVIGPAFASARGESTDAVVIHDAAMHAWHVGMATMVLIGVFKLIMSFFGATIQRLVPQAGLLGTLGGIGIALLGCLQFGELFHEPIAGFAAMGVIWYSLIGKIHLPFKAPEVLVSAALGTALFYGLWAAGWSHSQVDLSNVSFPLGFPMPNLGFVTGMPTAFGTYLPMALPFAILTVVGGINVNESARLAGDDYDTQQILVVEAVATLLAGVCGGVSQSTPYIGQPAYKAMGARAGYTLATGLFIGLGGILGYIPFLAAVLPKPALVPILLFVGADIVEQSFHATPKKHAMAVVFAMFPNIAQFAFILMIQTDFHVQFAALDPTFAAQGISADFIPTATVFMMLAHGFILTGMLWGGALAFLIDRRAVPAAAMFGVCSVFTLFGIIHSVHPDGGVYLPWTIGSTLPLHWAIGYAIVAVTVLVLSLSKEFREVPADAHPPVAPPIVP